MSHLKWILAAAMGLGLIGCDRKDTDAVKESANKAADAAKEAASSAKDAADSAAASARDAAAKLAADAETKIAEITQYIKENKLEAAETALTQVEKIKAQLPEAVQTKLTEARTALDAAKAKKAA